MAVYTIFKVGTIKKCSLKFIGEQLLFNPLYKFIRDNRRVISAVAGGKNKLK